MNVIGIRGRPWLTNPSRHRSLTTRKEKNLLVDVLVEKLIMGQVHRPDLVLTWQLLFFLSSSSIYYRCRSSYFTFNPSIDLISGQQVHWYRLQLSTKSKWLMTMHISITFRKISNGIKFIHAHGIFGYNTSVVVITCLYSDTRLFRLTPWIAMILIRCFVLKREKERKYFPPNNSYNLKEKSKVRVTRNV